MYAEITIRRDDGTVIHTMTVCARAVATEWHAGPEPVVADGVALAGYRFMPYLVGTEQEIAFADAMKERAQQALAPHAAGKPVSDVVILGGEA